MASLLEDAPEPVDPPELPKPEAAMKMMKKKKQSIEKEERK